LVDLILNVLRFLVFGADAGSGSGARVALPRMAFVSLPSETASLADPAMGSDML